MSPQPPITTYLSTGFAALDRALGGGLALGSLSEWGLPLGQLGREVIARCLAEATQAGFWCLWVSARERLLPFPPAWKARGIDLQRLCWVNSTRPLHELRPLLMDPFFRVIVFDAPQRLSLGDTAFLAQQTRRHQRLTLVLRDRLLRADAGSVWTRVRLNAWQDEESRIFIASILKGSRGGKNSTRLELEAKQYAL